MSNHTSGPWVVGRQAIGPRSTEDDQSYGMVLHVAHVQSSDFPDQQDANARLIAAAPDLLAVAEEALAALYNPFEPDNQSRAYLRLKEVIAKAKGEA